MKIEGLANKVSVGENVTLSGSVTGNSNEIIIGNARSPSTLRIFVNGNNNKIAIEDFYQIKDLSINCGNHVAASNTRAQIGRQFSVEPGSCFLLYNSGNTLSIGSDCLFSSGITIRCGESPHLLFDRHTGEYLDVSEGVYIGDHVWIGERAYITKRATVPNNCIVAACAVVTRRFAEAHVVLGGNPARVVRKDIDWIRNKDFLENDSLFYQNFQKFQAKHI